MIKESFNFLSLCPSAHEDECEPSDVVAAHQSNIYHYGCHSADVLICLVNNSQTD